MIGMTNDQVFPLDARRKQIHIWVDSDIAEYVRERAHRERRSRGKTVEGILRAEMVMEVPHEPIVEQGFYQALAESPSVLVGG
jgi:hypothetical protein